MLNANCRPMLEFDCVESSFCEVLYPWPGVCLSVCLPVDVDVLSKRMNVSNWFWLILHRIFGKFRYSPNICNVPRGVEFHPELLPFATFAKARRLLYLFIYFLQ